RPTPSSPRGAALARLRSGPSCSSAPRAARARWPPRAAARRRRRRPRRPRRPRRRPQ
ncbi:unnamed protein product, partial [Prorocentrum cordatum]